MEALGKSNRVGSLARVAITSSPCYRPSVKKIPILFLALSLLTTTASALGYFVPRSLDEVVREREESASSASAALLIPELSALWDHEDPEAVLAAVTQAAEDSRSPAWVAGYYSWVQASLLLRQGFTDVINAAGGMTGYGAAGFAPRCAVCYIPHASHFLGKDVVIA